MSSLGKREKILIGLLGVAAFFYLYYIAFLNPFLKKIDAANDRVEKCKAVVEKIKEAERNIDNQRGELEELKVTLEKYLDAMPEMERNPEIAYNLKKLGDTNKVSILALSLGEPIEFKADANADSSKTEEGVKKIYAIPVSMNANGDYGPIMSYINSIEKDKRIADIKAVGINSDPQNGDLNLILTMNYYYTSRITDKALDYDFNTGIYGKGNLFK